MSGYAVTFARSARKELTSLPSATVVYRVDDALCSIDVIAIGHRRDVYR